MEWKMEWYSERTKLQLSHITGTAQLIQVEVLCDLLSHRSWRLYEQVYNIVQMFLRMVQSLAYHQLLL